jgi:hypothetical protein
MIVERRSNVKNVSNLFFYPKNALFSESYNALDLIQIESVRVKLKLLGGQKISSLGTDAIVTVCESESFITFLIFPIWVPYFCAITLIVKKNCPKIWRMVCPPQKFGYYYQGKKILFIMH